MTVGLLLHPDIRIARGNPRNPLYWKMLRNVQLLLPPYNALYYSKQSVANYAVHYMMTKLGGESMAGRIKSRISVTVGAEIMDWDDALDQLLPKKEMQHVARGGS